jgi:hypothetical protein
MIWTAEFVPVLKLLLSELSSVIVVGDPEDSVWELIVFISYNPAEEIAPRSPKLELSEVLLPITSSCICRIMTFSPSSNESSDSSMLLTERVLETMEVTFAYPLIT